MKLIWAILKNILTTIIFWGIIAAIVFYGWNLFKKKREGRTFTVSFDHIEGLSKGAPIYTQGVKIGKVIDIFPLGNTTDLAVKGLITNKDYSVPSSAVGASIVSDIEGGGGKILEIQSRLSSLEPEHILMGKKRAFNKNGMTLAKAESPFTTKHAMRLMRDFFQMTKDSSMTMLKAFNSEKSERYREEVSNRVNNTITSLEYGTVKADVRNQIHELNKEIKDFEAGVDKEAQIEKAIQHSAQALSNTINSFGTLQSIYKKH
ncbi:MAG: MlaD family protein [Cyanobacteria bacterium]|nr:MlaD family protein [Cyanobacteriota bacterium]MDA1021437.1 MlaD family protein [Cyanobacteriota bacterium]